MRRDMNYPVVRILKVNDQEQWGYATDETDNCLVLAYPLGEGEYQTISVPWHRIDTIFSEDWKDAPWNRASFSE